MLRRYLLIIRKILNNPISWTVNRVKREVRQPELPVSRLALSSIFWVANKFRRQGGDNQDKILNLIYDLRNAPATYNVCDVLLSTELKVLNEGYQGIHIHFLRPSDEIQHGEYFPAVKIKYRLEQLLVPVAQMHGCVESISVHSDPTRLMSLVGKYNTFPREYHPFLNIQLPNSLNPFAFKKFKGWLKGVKSSAFGKSVVDAFLQRKSLLTPLVTIVIRSQTYDNARNSRLEDWIKFAKYLVSQDFTPVIIPDTESLNAIASFPSDIPVFVEAAVNVDVRMAIYERSFVVMGAPGGALAFAQFNPFVAFVEMNLFPSNSINNTKVHLESFFGKDLCNLSKMWWIHKNSKFSLLEDTYDNLVFEFNDFKKRAVV